jgi:mevalonate kinase
MKTIHNVETGEITERTLNAEEKAQQKIDEAAWNEKQASIEAKASARQQVLEKLGITEDELRLLGL